jgi:hypothetical protein
VKKPTGSKLHRVWKCPASAILPHDVNDFEEERTAPPREHGKVVHRFLEQVRKVGFEVALAEVPEDAQPLCKALDIDQLPTHCATEVAYAYNWRTRKARELGRNLGHRNYHLLPNPPTDDEIPCTLDVVGVAEMVEAGATRRPARRAYVGDYKRGHTTYPRPADYAQTLLGGLCARSALEADDVVLELIYIHDDGGHHQVRDLVDEWTLDVFADQLEELYTRLEALEADYRGGRGVPTRVGVHCTHCPAIKQCSGQVGMIRAVPAELVKLGVKKAPDGSLQLEAGAVTVRNAAAVYEAAEAIEAIAKRLKGEACQLAWHQPIQLSDGRVIEPVESSRRTINAKVAVAVLEHKFGREAAMGAIKLTTSFEAISKVLVEGTNFNVKPKPKMTTQKGDGIMDKLVAEIAAQGGIETKTSTSCEPRMPRKKKLAAGS